MSGIQGEKAVKFLAWLECISGLLPKSMTLEEASSIFLRRCREQEETAEKFNARNCS